MKYIYGNDKMTTYDDTMNIAGFITYPGVKKGLVNISDVWISPAWRGLGLDAQMMPALLSHLNEQEKKIVVTAPVAQRYMAEHPEWRGMFANVHFSKH